MEVSVTSITDPFRQRSFVWQEAAPWFFKSV
jgi:hypothetical protein